MFFSFLSSLMQFCITKLVYWSDVSAFFFIMVSTKTFFQSLTIDFVGALV